MKTFITICAAPKGARNGDYYAKIEVSGYELEAPRSVAVMENQETTLDFTVTQRTDGNYFYQWKADELYFGYEENAKVIKPLSVQFLEEQIYICDNSASLKFTFYLLH